jgi:hypothetical protein
MMRYSPLNLSNGFTLRDTYPTAQGTTTSQQTSGATTGPAAQTGGANDEVSAAALPGGVNPLIGGLVFFGLVFGLMFLAKRLGTDDDFRSLRPSVYNVVTIALAATAGMPLLKYAAVKAKIPGVSAWILAA